VRYPSTIRTARYRLSRGGHRMLLVVHALEGVAPPHDQVADYFTLEGVSPRGVATARRRLGAALPGLRAAPRAR
jgi:hypothetical protein